MPNNYVSSIAIDHQEVKRFGAEGYGLAKFDGMNREVTNKYDSDIK